MTGRVVFVGSIAGALELIGDRWALLVIRDLSLGLRRYDDLRASTGIFYDWLSMGTYEQTLPFYLKRTVTLVAFADEMAYGLEQEPGLWLRDIASFERVWRNTDYAVAVMPPHVYERLTRDRLPMTVIARDARLVVATTPPAV